jgi:hypothetical protein
MSGQTMAQWLYDRVDFITDLVFNRNFEKLIKSIKNFIKKGGD